jgi:hypothetical protein
MLPLLSHRLKVFVLVVATAAVAAVVAHGLRARRPPNPAPIAIQDGKTIDFSGGTAVIKDSPADKAALDSTVKAMDEAAKTVTFPADAPAKK